MASSLAFKRFLSFTPLISRSLLRPVASSAARSFNTNALRHYDQRADDRSLDVVRHYAHPTSILLQYGKYADDSDVDADSLDDDLSAGVIDYLDDRPLVSACRGIGAGFHRGWDAKEAEDALHLRVDMPGLGKEDVKLSVKQNTLTIKGEGAMESGDEEEGGRRYSNRIDLPDNLFKLDQIKAEMKNGVLKVVVPKMKEEERTDVFNVKIE